MKHSDINGVKDVKLLDAPVWPDPVPADERDHISEPRKPLPQPQPKGTDGSAIKWTCPECGEEVTCDPGQNHLKTGEIKWVEKQLQDRHMAHSPKHSQPDTESETLVTPPARTLPDNVRDAVDQHPDVARFVVNGLEKSPDGGAVPCKALRACMDKYLGRARNLEDVVALEAIAGFQYGMTYENRFGSEVFANVQIVPVVAEPPPVETLADEAERLRELRAAQPPYPEPSSSSGSEMMNDVAAILAAESDAALPLTQDCPPTPHRGGCTEGCECECGHANRGAIPDSDTPSPPSDPDANGRDNKRIAEEETVVLNGPPLLPTIDPPEGVAALHRVSQLLGRQLSPKEIAAAAFYIHEVGIDAYLAMLAADPSAADGAPIPDSDAPSPANDPDLIDLYIAAVEQRNYLATAHETAKETVREMEEPLRQEFIERGTQSVNRHGWSVHMRRDLWARVLGEDRDKAYAALRALPEWRHLVTETVNAQSLKSTVRSLQESRGLAKGASDEELAAGILPASLRAHIGLGRQTTIRATRSRKES